MQTNFLRAGHGPRRPRRRPAPEALAQYIVASILQAQADGRHRVPEEYSQQPDTLAAVRTLLAQVGQAGGEA